MTETLETYTDDTGRVELSIQQHDDGDDYGYSLAVDGEEVDTSRRFPSPMEVVEHVEDNIDYDQHLEDDEGDEGQPESVTIKLSMAGTVNGDEVTDYSVGVIGDGTEQAEEWFREYADIAIRHVAHDIVDDERGKVPLEYISENAGHPIGTLTVYKPEEEGTRPETDWGLTDQFYDAVESYEPRFEGEHDDVPAFANAHTIGDIVDLLTTDEEYQVPNVTDKGYEVGVQDDPKGYADQKKIVIAPKYDNETDVVPYMELRQEELRHAGWTWQIYDSPDSEKGLIEPIEDPYGMDEFNRDSWGYVESISRGTDIHLRNKPDFENSVSSIAFRRLFKQEQPYFENKHRLTRAKGVSDSKAQELLYKFGDVESVELATKEELVEVEGIGEGTAQNIIRSLNDGRREASMEVLGLSKYIHGTSRTTLRPVAEEYDTVEEVLDASVSDLTGFYGIGNTLAKDIKWVAEKEASLGEVDPQLTYDEASDRAHELKDIALETGVVKSVNFPNSGDTASGHYYPDRRVNVYTNLTAKEWNPSFKLPRAKVLAHEIGHGLEHPLATEPEQPDQVLGLRYGIAKELVKNSSREVRRELEYVHREWSGDSRDLTYELWCNFIAWLTVAPEKTRLEAPNAVSRLEDLTKELRGARAEVLTKLLEDDFEVTA